MHSIADRRPDRKHSRAIFIITTFKRQLLLPLAHSLLWFGKQSSALASILDDTCLRAYFALENSTRATSVARFPSLGDTYSRLGNGKAISRGTFSVPRLFSCARYIFRTLIRFLCARYVFRTSIVFVREVRIPYLDWFFVREVCILYLDWFFVCEVRIPYLDCFCARGTVSVPRLGFCIRGTDSVPRLVLCTRYGFRTSIGFLCEVYGGYLGVLFMSDEDCAGYTWVKYVYLIV